jgi:hypothetical protein
MLAQAPQLYNQQQEITNTNRRQQQLQELAGLLEPVLGDVEAGSEVLSQWLSESNDDQAAGSEADTADEVLLNTAAAASMQQEREGFVYDASSGAVLLQEANGCEEDRRQGHSISTSEVREDEDVQPLQQALASSTCQEPSQSAPCIDTSTADVDSGNASCGTTTTAADIQQEQWLDHEHALLDRVLLDQADGLMPRRIGSSSSSASGLHNPVPAAMQQAAAEAPAVLTEPVMLHQVAAAHAPVHHPEFVTKSPAAPLLSSPLPASTPENFLATADSCKARGHGRGSRLRQQQQSQVQEQQQSQLFGANSRLVRLLQAQQSLDLMGDSQLLYSLDLLETFQRGAGSGPPEGPNPTARQCQDLPPAALVQAGVPAAGGTPEDVDHAPSCQQEQVSTVKSLPLLHQPQYHVESMLMQLPEISSLAASDSTWLARPAGQFPLATGNTDDIDMVATYELKQSSTSQLLLDLEQQQQQLHADDQATEATATHPMAADPAAQQQVVVLASVPPQQHCAVEADIMGPQEQMLRWQQIQEEEQRLQQQLDQLVLLQKSQQQEQQNVESSSSHYCDEMPTSQEYQSQQVVAMPDQATQNPLFADEIGDIVTTTSPATAVGAKDASRPLQHEQQNWQHLVEASSEQQLMPRKAEGMYQREPAQLDMTMELQSVGGGAGPAEGGRQPIDPSAAAQLADAVQDADVLRTSFMTNPLYCEDDSPGGDSQQQRVASASSGGQHATGDGRPVQFDLQDLAAAASAAAASSTAAGDVSFTGLIKRLQHHLLLQQQQQQPVEDGFNLLQKGPASMPEQPQLYQQQQQQATTQTSSAIQQPADMKPAAAGQQVSPSDEQSQQQQELQLAAEDMVCRQLFEELPASLPTDVPLDTPPDVSPPYAAAAAFSPAAVLALDQDLADCESAGPAGSSNEAPSTAAPVVAGRRADDSPRDAAGDPWELCMLEQVVSSRFTPPVQEQQKKQTAQHSNWKAMTEHKQLHQQRQSVQEQKQEQEQLLQLLLRQMQLLVSQQQQEQEQQQQQQQSERTPQQSNSRRLQEADVEQQQLHRGVADFVNPQQLQQHSQRVSTETQQQHFKSTLGVLPLHVAQQQQQLLQRCDEEAAMPAVVRQDSSMLPSVPVAGACLPDSFLQRSQQQQGEGAAHEVQGYGTAQLLKPNEQHFGVKEQNSTKQNTAYDSSDKQQQHIEASGVMQRNGCRQLPSVLQQQHHHHHHHHHHHQGLNVQGGIVSIQGSMGQQLPVATPAGQNVSHVMLTWHDRIKHLLAAADAAAAENENIKLQDYLLPADASALEMSDPTQLAAAAIAASAAATRLQAATASNGHQRSQIWPSTSKGYPGSSDGIQKSSQTMRDVTLQHVPALGGGLLVQQTDSRGDAVTTSGAAAAAAAAAACKQHKLAAASSSSQAGFTQHLEMPLQTFFAADGDVDEHARSLGNGAHGMMQSATAGTAGAQQQPRLAALLVHTSKLKHQRVNGSKYDPGTASTSSRCVQKLQSTAQAGGRPAAASRAPRPQPAAVGVAARRQIPISSRRSQASCKQEQQQQRKSAPQPVLPAAGTHNPRRSTIAKHAPPPPPAAAAAARGGPSQPARVHRTATAARSRGSFQHVSYSGKTGAAVADSIAARGAAHSAGSWLVIPDQLLLISKQQQVQQAQAGYSSPCGWREQDEGMRGCSGGCLDEVKLGSLYDVPRPSGYVYKQVKAAAAMDMMAAGQHLQHQEVQGHLEQRQQLSYGVAAATNHRKAGNRHQAGQQQQPCRPAGSAAGTSCVLLAASGSAGRNAAGAMGLRAAGVQPSHGSRASPRPARGLPAVKAAAAAAAPCQGRAQYRQQLQSPEERSTESVSSQRSPSSGRFAAVACSGRQNAAAPAAAAVASAPGMASSRAGLATSSKTSNSSATYLRAASRQRGPCWSSSPQPLTRAASQAAQSTVAVTVKTHGLSARTSPEPAALVSAAAAAAAAGATADNSWGKTNAAEPASRHVAHHRCVNSSSSTELMGATHEGQTAGGMLAAATAVRAAAAGFRCRGWQQQVRPGKLRLVWALWAGCRLQSTQPASRPASAAAA